MEDGQHGRPDHQADAQQQRAPFAAPNVLMLWASAVEHGFGFTHVMTFKQALELNAHVRKGQKGSFMVYANSVVKNEQNDGETVTTRSAS